LQSRVPILFGPKGDEVVAGCRKLRNDGHQNVNCPPNMIKKIKSRRMRVTGHVARMVEKKACRALEGKSEGRETTRKNCIEVV
jgi:hypothetical protein